MNPSHQKDSSVTNSNEEDDSNPKDRRSRKPRRANRKMSSKFDSESYASDALSKATRNLSLKRKQKRSVSIMQHQETLIGKLQEQLQELRTTCFSEINRLEA